MGTIGSRGHSGTEWIPTAKRTHGTSAVNAEIWGWLAPFFKAKKEAVNFKLRTYDMAITCKMCLFSLYFVKYMTFIY